MTIPAPRQILDLPLPPNDAGAATVRDYLIELLAAVWREADLFSGKRPFGASGWPYEVYPALVTAGYVTGQFDGDGYLEDCDIATADRLIDSAIRGLGDEPVTYIHPDDIDLDAAVNTTSNAIMTDVVGVGIADSLESLESLEAEIRRLRGQRSKLADTLAHIAGAEAGDPLQTIASDALAEVGLNVDGTARTPPEGSTP